MKEQTTSSELLKDVQQPKLQQMNLLTKKKIKTD